MKLTPRIVRNLALFLALVGTTAAVTMPAEAGIDVVVCIEIEKVKVCYTDKK